MENLSVILISGSIGLASFFIGIYLSYRRYKLFKSSLVDNINNAENELKADILEIGISNLRKTRAGKELFNLLSQNMIEATTEPKSIFPLALEKPEIFDKVPTESPSSSPFASRLEKQKILHEARTKSSLPNPYHPDKPAVTSLKRHQIRSFPVLGQIPAGVPANVSERGGTMMFEDVILDGVYYRIISLKQGENIIDLPNGKDYYVLKVSGNSMNTAWPEPILNGDYVLIREQVVANDGDIVACAIIDVDNLATLKRYTFEDGRPVLKPESDDLAFQNPIFLKTSDKLYIQGVALAILKRLAD